MRTWEDIREAVARENSIKESLLAFAQEILETASEAHRESINLSAINEAIQEHADDMLEALTENTEEEIVDQSVNEDTEFNPPPEGEQEDRIFVIPD